MDVLSTSLLLPLILDFLKERRHRGESEDFADFKVWLSDNIDQLASKSADSFDAIRQSQDLQQGKLDEVLNKLDIIFVELSGPSIDQLWSALEPGERSLLKRMFLVLCEQPEADDHLDLGKYSSDAQRLNERGLAQVRETTASYGVALTDSGAVLGWAQFDSESLSRFEAALRKSVPEKSATTRLGDLIRGLKIPDSLALNYVKLLSEAGFVDLEDNTWPPGQSLIYNVSESFRKNPPQAADLLKSRLSEYWR